MSASFVSYGHVAPEKIKDPKAIHRQHRVILLPIPFYCYSHLNSDPAHHFADPFQPQTSACCTRCDIHLISLQSNRLQYPRPPLHAYWSSAAASESVPVVAVGHRTRLVSPTFSVNSPINPHSPSRVVQTPPRPPHPIHKLGSFDPASQTAPRTFGPGSRPVRPQWSHHQSIRPHVLALGENRDVRPR